MVFSSLEFMFLFFPVTIIAYFLVPKKHLKWRNLVLLAVSLVFYGWGEPIYVFLMMFTILVDYVSGYFVDRYVDTDRKKAKFILVLCIVINIGLLGFFKYTGFILSIFGITDTPLANIPLPIGISFYTFQALSYVFDVYMRQGKVQTNVVSFGSYVTLFPQLIAGPIVRYQDVDDMLRERDENIALAASGARTFLAGFAKKIFFANIAGQMWETFKNVPMGERSIIGCWIGMICYAFQIYFDFSAYSDMAIGLGKIIGFKFLENFNYPYISKSITEFWRRWHMSLSTWFRDYVYFPLGGSRCSPLRNYMNLLVVWLLTGFWHGASWNYVLWGLYYFALLVIEKAFLLKKIEKLPAFFQHIYTLFFVLFGWLLFVFEDLGAGMVYLGNMFGAGVSTSVSQADLYEISRNFPFFVILFIAATPLPKRLFYKFYEKSQFVKFAAYLGGIAVLVLGVAYLVDSSFNPFLYFRF
ncbi:MAG: MBOAT family protein [Oscillospiraceae bacterium]|nr:MBOAT family protein [Oscillospiraceae bacterium]